MRARAIVAAVATVILSLFSTLAGGGAASAASAPTVPQLSAVRAAAHPGFDRLVFQFNGPVPAYALHWVPTVTQDPSGLPVPLGGKAFLHVVFPSATAHTATGQPTYAGTLPTRFDLPVLRSVRTAGDFENVLSFGVGVWQKTALHAYTLTAPSRLVIDIAVPSGPGPLSELDNGRLVYLHVGQHAFVQLRTCVSCGYTWRIASAPSPLMLRPQWSNVVPLPHPAGMVGFPYESQWMMLAVGPGYTTLWLYEYPPQPGAAPVARYLLRFTIAG